jgi:FKBP12-rapamycin complex-associated protein
MVEPSLQVITSKQRPRKLSIRGNNGRIYMFLLKGHEDLRQDERVMQFFSLVNSLLVNDPETLRRNLAIQRFAVIPLSTNSVSHSNLTIFYNFCVIPKADFRRSRRTL